MKQIFIPKDQIQTELFAALSEMYGREAPLYKLLLAVNKYVNQLEVKEHPELGVTPAALNQISSERHGAIRVATPTEFAAMNRFFKVMDMFPHNAYLMTNAGAKSQPIIGTGFRAKEEPTQRMFCSTLMIDYFDAPTQTKIKKALEDRNVFSESLVKLIRKSEVEGGLERDDATKFVQEGTKLFQWSGKGKHYELYTELKQSGNGVAADIVCFPNPHLNHLTPSSLNIDRLMDTMKEVLSAKTPEQIPAEIKALMKNVPAEEIALYLNNNGMKDTIEGPATPKPGKALVFLRQVSYKALPEKVTFSKDAGGTIDATHTARFGEIEQRGVAMTPKGRKIYDECLVAAEKIDQKLAQTNYEEYEKQYAECFKPLEKSHAELKAEGLAYYDKNGPIRYDDFLPVSAAGIFASNLQDDAKAAPLKRPEFTKIIFEKATKVSIIEADQGYAARAK